MSKGGAIEYLLYLHSLEMKYRKNLITQELAALVERVRLEFIVLYKGK